jgi:uncharacterized membrane protein
MNRIAYTIGVAGLLTLCLAVPAAFAAKDNPNIIVIWGDDIGWSNVSAYNNGMMGTKYLTSIVSPMKARCLPTFTPNRAVPLVAHSSSSASTRFEPIC